MIRKFNPWLVICALCIFPLAAVLHHAVFFRPGCMFGSFGNGDSISTIRNWLSHDPSFWLAILAMGVIYTAGKSNGRLHKFLFPVPLAFLPLTLWIWDIPFTKRWLCHTFHDGRFSVGGVFFRTSYWYVLGVFLYFMMSIRLFKKRPGAEEVNEE